MFARLPKLMLHSGGRRRINEVVTHGDGWRGGGVAKGDGDGGIERAREGVQTVLYTVSKRMF